MFLGLHREICGEFGAGNERRGTLLVMGGGATDEFMSARVGSGRTDVGESTRVLLGDGDGLGGIKLETVKRSGVRRC